MMWIVTGYSGKNDGICYAVEADTGWDACQKVAKLSGLIFTQLDYNDGCADIMYHPEYDLEYLRESYNNGDGPRRCYELYYEPVTLNHNLTGAVCW